MTDKCNIVHIKYLCLLEIYDEASLFHMYISLKILTSPI